MRGRRILFLLELPSLLLTTFYRKHKIWRVQKRRENVQCRRKTMLEENLFENILASLRTRRGWTQEDAAAHIGKGISRHTYSDLETGKLPPSPKHLKLIAAGFKLNQADTDALYRVAHHESPKLHNLPFDQNLLFTGREALLEQLSQLLKENYSVALTGLAGIGKTQIALEYGHRCYVGKVYQAVFWVNAADEALLKIGYATLAEKLDLPERDEQELDKIVQAVKNWLEWHTNWLLIMDNADNLQLARSFFPKSHNGHILLTTRTQMVGNVARKIDIGRMEPSEGQLFLLLRSDVLKAKTKLDTFAADIRNASSQVVELLDGHPLALDQAGAYINDGASFTEYINLYNERRSELLSKRGLLDEEDKGKYSEYPDTVVVTFELCFDKARERHPLSIDILRFCAFLHPDAIPDELFQHDETFKSDATSFIDGRRALLRYSLIRRNTEEQTCSMHRLVQAVLIDAIPPDLQKQWRERVVRALDASFPVNAEFHNWRQCERLLAHVLSCSTWTEDELNPTLAVARLFHLAGHYLAERGQYLEAEPLMGLALSIHVQNLGIEHRRTASALSDLANLYSMQGDYSLAEPMYQRAIAIHEKQLGAEHPDTVKCLHNLATLYAKQGKYEQAKPLLEQVLSIQRKYLGAEHPYTAKSVYMLASLYHDQREYGQAEVLYRQALSLWQLLANRLGSIHPETALPLHALALLMQDQGKHEQAEDFYQRALYVQERKLGGEHPHTQATKRDYANFLRSLGRDAEAVALAANDESPV
jgi:tetratricopeptide (TPR) repeat protein